MRSNLDESIEWSCSKSIIFWLEFDHGVTHLDKSDGWAVFCFKAKEFKNTTIIIDISINQYKKGCSLVVLGGSSEFGSNGIELTVGFGNEEKEMLGNITTEDFWGSFFIKFIDF